MAFFAGRRRLSGGQSLHELESLSNRDPASRYNHPRTNSTRKSPVRWLRSATFLSKVRDPKNILSQMAVALVPSYWQHLVGGERLKPTKVHEIAPLDGLRGWACLLVFNFHFLFTYTWAVSTGWGFAGQNYGIHQLPIVHILISGHIMVAIFFVISGYVLSHHPLKLMRRCHCDGRCRTLDF